jgi:hypothetical protein
MQEAPQSSPSSKGYGPYEILGVCCINLWPVVRMELGNEGWPKQPVPKIRGPIVAGDQGSRWDHHCSETLLTGDPSSRSVGAPLGCKLLPPVAGSKRLPTGPARLCSGRRMQEAPQ